MNKNKPKIGFRGSYRENILEDLTFAAKNNFDCFEVGALELEPGIKPNIAKKAKNFAKDNNIALSFHIPWFLKATSLIPEISEATVNFIKKEILLANDLGTKTIVLHSGKADIDDKKEFVAKNFEILIKNLKEIVKFAGEYGIKIGLENSFSKGQLSRTPNDLIKTVKLVNGLGITFDTGHANLTEINPIDYFKKIKKDVIHIHVHDNHGKKEDEHLIIGKGNIDFKSFFRECKRSGYYGPFVLELNPYKKSLEARKIILKIWDKV